MGEKQAISVPFTYSLYNNSFINGIKDFLQIFSDEDIFSIAQTACSKKINPVNREEAMEVILIYTPDIERLFSYKRVNSNILYEYLHRNHISIKGHATQHHLISRVRALWAKKYSKLSNEVQNQVTSSSGKRESDSTIETQRHFVKSDVFAKDFVQWFYTCLNSSSRVGGTSSANTINSSLFCSNASVDLFIVNSNIENETHVEGDEECALAIQNMNNSLGLSFSPNLENGTQALKSTHGLIKILACGTLHKEAQFMGIFEQEFGLVQSPIDRNWKIFYTKANLKFSVTSIPSLPPCTIFEIES